MELSKSILSTKILGHSNEEAELKCATELRGEESVRQAPSTISSTVLRTAICKMARSH